jgi:Pyridoxamine 5'-phosphate oxidase
MGAGWAHLEAADPELAARGRALVERPRLLLLGTLRADGAPRISPVEAHLVNGQLALAVIPHSRKARDLERDPRLVLQSPVTDAADPGEELKVRGRALAADHGMRRAIAAAVEHSSGWRPGESWLMVTVELGAVAHIEWLDGEMVLRRWTAATGPRPPERRRLDIQAGAYVPTPPGSLGP